MPPSIFVPHGAPTFALLPGAPDLAARIVEGLREAGCPARARRIQ